MPTQTLRKGDLKGALWGCDNHGYHLETFGGLLPAAYAQSEWTQRA